MPSFPARFRVVLAVSAAASVLLVGVGAGAQGGDKVAAEALFEQGRKLMADGKFAEACPKFADSERLDPSPGTLLNLASCYEKQGRSATAWATYKEAASAANAAGRADYVTTAQHHADALASKLATLTATVTKPVDGLVVRRDGVDVAKSAWGVPIPIDAGSHAIEASAPGYKTWSTTVDIAQDGGQATVTVPALEAAPVASAPVPPPAAPAPSAPAPAPAAPTGSASTGSTQRILGLVVAGVGVAGLGASAIVAVLAKNKYNDSLQNCPTDPNVCNGTGVSQRNDALRDGNISTVVFSVGAAALVGGVIVWLTAPSASGSSSSAASAHVVVQPTLGGAVVQGAW
jgi:hypothetical protein